MAKARSATTSTTPKRRRPAINPEARENQLISMAYDLVEQRLIDGTASSQETTHFLKLGTIKAKTELEILQKQKELIVAKTEQLQSMKRSEELMAEAIKAFKSYSGQVIEDDEY